MSNSVPDGWKFERIENLTLCLIRDFGSFSTTKLIEFLDKGVPFIKSESVKQGTIDLNNVSFISEEVHQLLDKSYVNPGDILFTKIGAIGRAALYGGELGICNSNAATAKITINKKKADSQYITYQLVSERVTREFEKSIISTPPRINLGEINSMKIELPPLPEQKKIAAILTSVDTVIEKTQAQIDKLKDLKTGMMQELLTKGIGHTEFKDSPVGRIPVEWGVVTVLELGNGHKDTVQTGPFGAQLHSKDYVEEGIPLVLIKNIKEDGLDDTDIPKITEKDANRLSRYRLKEGDIVFSRVGRVGSCFLCSKNEEGWVFSGQTLRIRFNNSKVDLTYFNYALRTEEIQKELIGESVGSTRSSINTTILESLSVKLPPIQEQKKIASILQSLDSNIKSRELKLKQLMSVKKALMQDLLTGKVRVKL